MIPQETFEYKRKWMEENPNLVPFHSDKQDRAVAWCKLALLPKDYRLIQWYDTYTHAMCFKSTKESQLFDQEINGSDL